MEWLLWLEKFGLPTCFTLVIASFFFFLLKWVLEQSKVELIENRKERSQFLAILDKYAIGIQQHNQRSELFMDGVVKHHEKMINNLNEITITLGRINGYVKE